MKSKIEVIDYVDFDKLEDTFVPNIINYYLSDCFFNISVSVFRSLATSIVNIINKIKNFN